MKHTETFREVMAHFTTKDLVIIGVLLILVVVFSWIGWRHDRGGRR